jgi:hypothetical protein
MLNTDRERQYLWQKPKQNQKQKQKQKQRRNKKIGPVKGLILFLRFLDFVIYNNFSHHERKVTWLRFPIYVQIISTII